MDHQVDEFKLLNLGQTEKPWKIISELKHTYKLVARDPFASHRKGTATARFSAHSEQKVPPNSEREKRAKTIESYNRKLKDLQ